MLTAVAAASGGQVCYYQGMHDIASVLLMTADEHFAFCLLRHLAACQLRDCTRCAQWVSGDCGVDGSLPSLPCRTFSRSTTGNRLRRRWMDRSFKVATMLPLAM